MLFTTIKSNDIINHAPSMSDSLEDLDSLITLFDLQSATHLSVIRMHIVTEPVLDLNEDDYSWMD